MRFFRQQPAYLIVSLCVLAASWTLWSSQTAKASDSIAALTSEDKARQALTGILGKGNFQIFLTTESRLVLSNVRNIEPGNSVVEGEQTKLETLGRSSQNSNLELELSETKPDKDREYHNEVKNRTYLVGGKVTYEVSARTDISQIRCLVIVKKNPWSKVDVARSALTTLLGVDEKRGDKLTFEVAN